MKKLYFLFFTVLISFASFGQMINEFEPNPAGNDPTDSTFELKGTANTAFDLWILSIENDGFDGAVDRASNVTGTFDTNGLATLTIPDLENPSFTLVLTNAFTGSIGDDLDAANNGTLDTSTLGTILDAVSVSDEVADDASLYGVTLGGANILYNGEFEPLLAFRDGTTGDWYNTVTINFGTPSEAIAVFDASGNSVNAGNFDSNPTNGPTYGSINPTTSTASAKDDKIEGFEMYPNPTNLGYVNISSRNNTEINVSIFDVLGKQVISETLTNKRLDVSNLKAGVYIMKATEQDAVSTKKLVIR